MAQVKVGPKLENRFLSLGEPAIVVSPEQGTSANNSWLNSRGFVVALILLGIGLRIVPILQNRNLWIDEAMIALNLVERSASGLLEPLSWNQGAPVGFLLASKATITLFGASEWVLRLFPFVVSVLGLIGFAWLVRRMLPGSSGTLALALMAINPVLISYTAECKQYAIDAAIAIGLFTAAFGLLHGEGGLRRFLVLALSGAAAVWFSHPAAFVLGGIGTALFLEAAYNHDRQRMLMCSATIGCWLASFAACYLLTLQHLGNNQYLLDYWAGHFLPLPNSPGAIAWLVDHFFAFFAYPGGLGGTEFKIGGIAALLCLVGIGNFWRDRWPVAVALVVPALLALLASGVHKYPFAGRLLLFLVPLMLLAVARGVSAIVASLHPTQPFAARLIVGLLLLAPLVETYQRFKRPRRHEQITEVLAELRSRVQPGDKVYLYYNAAPAFTFYTRDEAFPVAVTVGSEFRQHRTGYRDELREFAGEPRVWVVFSHPYLSEESLIRAYAESLGDCQEEIHRTGTAAYRYDFRTVKP
ncbi:MAG: glycosyltransferase family 39 protein [Planctomycetes bacterium]|nr:glycosyltransferase family 39 protein [Planctomycetota bacterium]